MNVTGQALKLVSTSKNIVAALLLFLLCFTMPVSAQTQEEDVVYLKNGSILHGTIIEQKPGEFIKLRTNDGNIWAFRFDEIERLAKQGIGVVRKSKPMGGKKGYYNVSEIGFIVSQGMWTGLNTGLSASTANGYRFHRLFGTALVAGLDHYYGLPVIPASLEVRGTLLNKLISPVYFAQGGYGFPAPYESDQAEYQGGLTFHGGVGLMVTINEDCAFTFSMGLKTQHIIKTYNTWGTEIKEDNKYKRISLRAGLMF